MKISAAAVALLLTGCTALESRESKAWLALHAVDTLQSYHAAQQPECYEEGQSVTRRLIGRHPSDGEIVAWSLANVALHLGVTEWLLRNDHPMLAKAWQYMRIYDTADAIYENHGIGIRIGSPNRPRKGSCVSGPFY